MNGKTIPAAGEFDYIVVGAGSAGSVLAARLSDDERHSVLLIEEGPRDDSWFIRMPKGFGKLLEDPNHAAYHPTTHDRGNGQPEVWIRGKMLGGSSSINGMVWNRGVQADYDSMGALSPGWSWSDVFPYLKKIEDHALGETEAHGEGGPIPVRIHPDHTPLHEAVLAAGQSMGWTRREDIAGLQQEGIGYIQANINAKGERVSAARGFLTPQVRSRANLTIATGTRVDRIRFDGKRAVGVECTAGGQSQFYRARGEIILSAGALSSPKLLQLSGVGPGALLQSLGIPVVHDQPQVGANMREHWMIMQHFKLRDWFGSYNRDFAGMRLVAGVARYAMAGKGPMAYSSSEICGFIRSRPEVDRPDWQLMFSPYSFTTQNGRLSFDPFPGMQFYGYVLRPESLGSIRIESRDVAVPPRIELNYLSADVDRIATLAMFRQIRALAAQAPLKPFVEGETETTAHAQNDDEILALYRQMGQSGYHATGTCGMGSDPSMVLDPQLRVRGVQGLRVMDCSVYPILIAGNTNAPTMAMAWRAADVIKSTGMQT